MASGRAGANAAPIHGADRQPDGDHRCRRHPAADRSGVVTRSATYGGHTVIGGLGESAADIMVTRNTTLSQQQRRQVQIDEARL